MSTRLLRVVLRESSSDHVLFKGIVRVVAPKRVTEPEIFAMAAEKAAKEAKLGEDDDYQVVHIVPVAKKRG